MQYMCIYMYNKYVSKGELLPHCTIHCLTLRCLSIKIVMQSMLKIRITIQTETMETETILTSENPPSMTELLHTSLIEALLNNNCNCNSTNKIHLFCQQADALIKMNIYVNTLIHIYYS